ENMAVQLENGQNKVNVIGSMAKKAKAAGGGFGETPTITYKDVGIYLTVTPRVHTDKRITLEIHLRDVNAIVRDDAIAVGMDDKGAAIMAQEAVVTAFEGRVGLVSGHAMIAAGGQSSAKSSTARTLVIVSAKVME